MRVLRHRLLADENVNPAVVRTLREGGYDIVALHEIGARGANDMAVLALANAQQRVVLTHDADFGTLAIREGAPFLGIVYLRPGTIDADQVMAMLRRVDDLDVHAEGPFILVAELRGAEVRVRFRPVEVRS